MKKQYLQPTTEMERVAGIMLMQAPTVPTGGGGDGLHGDPAPAPIRF